MSTTPVHRLHHATGGLADALKHIRLEKTMLKTIAALIAMPITALVFGVGTAHADCTTVCTTGGSNGPDAVTCTTSCD